LDPLLFATLGILMRLNLMFIKTLGTLYMSTTSHWSITVYAWYLLRNYSL